MRKKSNETGMREMGIVSDVAPERLVAYHWAGNIREPENAAERALILSGKG